MKLEYEASILMALNLGLTLKGILKTKFRLIGPLRKSGVVQLPMERDHETHFVLCTWDIGWLVNYPFYGFQGLKGREAVKFITHENDKAI